MKKYGFLVACLLLFTSCEAQKKKRTVAKGTITKTTQKTTELTYLKEGEKILLKEYDLNISFSNIREDSRCPKGVSCVWEGAAIADISVMGSYTRPSKLSLASINNEAKNLSSFALFNGLKITLKEVSPYPTESVGFNKLKGQYKIGLLIEKYHDPSNNKTIQRTGTMEQ